MSRGNFPILGNFLNILEVFFFCGFWLFDGREYYFFTTESLVVKPALSTLSVTEHVAALSGGCPDVRFFAALWTVSGIVTESVW